MKIRKLILLSGVFGAVLLAVVSTQTSQAEVVISQKQIRSIQTHCVENQAALNQLHQTDAFLRIDRGNLYRTISDKLMTPLNTRLTANELPNDALVAVTKQFNAQYQQFYKNYITYDTSLSKLLSIDCTKEPVGFYNALIKTREDRQQLSVSNQALVQLIVNYKALFDQFKASFMAGNTR